MKKKSLIFIFISVFLLVLTSCKSNESETVTVFSGGESEYSIVISESASVEIKELADGLASLSGASPEILTDASSEKAFEILIGDTKRNVIPSLITELKEAASTQRFNYLIAERDGKLVILADRDEGYAYALDYIKETFISGDAFAIPKDYFAIKSVSWDIYYSSDRYYDKLIAEADKNRYEEGNDQFNNEMNRYDDNNGNAIMTVGQATEYYKQLAASFNTADFGTYTSSEFTSKNTYDAPTFYPGESHPRILFTENTIDTVRENLTASQNSSAYRKYLTLSSAPCDGKFKSLTGTMSENYDAGMAGQIEAKAFRYAMTGEKIYGYEAIYASKNAILTIDVPLTLSDACRRYGHLMYVVSCVYDWCYDLLTEKDKTELINGCVNILGKAQEIVRYKDSANKAPIAQGVYHGHGSEDQLLVDYLAFAIACFDEAPEIYELCAGRILNDYTEAQNYLYSSGSHGEGINYGVHRGMSTIVSNILFNKMSDGVEYPFSDALEEIAITMTYYIRPDDQPFRIGDLNENHTAYKWQGMGALSFYVGTLYDNDYLKSIAYKYLDNFTYFSNGTNSLSAIQFLAINDPEQSYIYEGTAPLTRTTGVGVMENGELVWPDRNIFARSANNDENAFALYMTMPDYYIAGHAHMECGSFQIFYKGILASDSGRYSSWGGDHHFGYTAQTVASNSLIIFNPNLVGTYDDYRTNLIYTGGQSIKNCTRLPTLLDDHITYPTAYNWCESLGTANVEKDGVYLYSYMGGDMTGAYDEETVDEVTRYMVAVATGYASAPLVFLTFDRITSDDASYHKAALIHTQEAPIITEDGFAIVTNTKNGNNGKMIVQTVGYDTKYDVIGGEGKEYWIAGVDENGNYSLADGYNMSTSVTLVEGSIAEYGWGRIEISPAEEALTNHMLTVMYVTDADNNSAPVKAENITSDNLSGAMIFGKAILFPTNEKLLKSESSFTLTKSGECFIAGVSAGTWTVTHGTETQMVTVAEGENLLTFTAKTAGAYTITPAN